MQNQNFFLNEDEFPDTHFFLYHGEKYPIKIDFFKLSSKYFARNQDLFFQSKTIPLIDESSEPSLNITNDNIDTFIKFVQHKQIQINNENVVTLNYLANRFEVTSLINITQDYISQNHQNIALQILSIHQDDESFDTNIYEQTISQNILHYIQNDLLLTIQIPILYRILEKAKLNDHKKEINVFLFKCLKKFGRQASCLFTFADFNDERYDDLALLMRDFSSVFDFHFIDSKMIVAIYDKESKNIHDEIERKILVESEIQKLREEITSIKTDYSNQIKNLNQKYDDKIRSIEGELKNAQETIQSLVGEMKAKDDKNKEQDNLIQKLLNYYNDVVNKVTQLEKKS